MLVWPEPSHQIRLQTAQLRRLQLAAEQARIESLAELPSSARVVLVRARNRRQEGDHAEAARLLADWLAEHPEARVALVPCELAVYPGLFHGGDMFLPTARVSQRLERGLGVHKGESQAQPQGVEQDDRPGERQGQHP